MLVHAQSGDVPCRAATHALQDSWVAFYEQLTNSDTSLQSMSCRESW